MRIPEFIRVFLLTYCDRICLERSHNFVVGASADPLLLRWHLIPRNAVFNVYLHVIKRSDKDKELHDHPWHNCSILINGGYQEIMPTGVVERREGEVIFRRASALHRLELIDETPVISLFLTSPKVREWGFQCAQGWIHWKEFVKPGSPGEVGNGCGN